MDKMFVVTRRDLAPGAQLAQSCHAAFAFSAEHGEAERWARATLAVLAVADERELDQLIERARRRYVRISVFREPDFGDAITAIAIEPGRDAERLTSGLGLALREQAPMLP